MTSSSWGGKRIDEKDWVKHTTWQVLTSRARPSLITKYTDDRWYFKFLNHEPQSMKSFTTLSNSMH